MKGRPRFYWLTALLIVIGITAFYFRKEVPDAYARYLSYNRLYFVSDLLHVTDIRRLSGDRVEIAFGGAVIQPSNHFEVYDKAVKVLDVTAPSLVLSPGKGEHGYHIRINSRDSCTIHIDFPEISVPSLPVLPGSLETPRAWSRYDTLGTGEDSTELIKSYLEDSMRIQPGDPSEIRVKKIARYILSITSGQSGAPSAEMAHLPAIGQLRCVQAGRSRLLCGGYSDIFAFFTNKAGVPCRYIEAGGSLRGLNYATHVVNEVWLKEYGCWAYADLTDGIVSVTKDGRLLNTLDIQRLLQYPMDSSLMALHYEGDSLVSRPFRKVGASAVKAFDRNTVFTYYYGRYERLANPKNLAEKIKSLLSPEAYYAFYSDNYSPVNYPFYFRVYSGYLFLLLLALWSGMVVRRPRRR